MIENGAVEIDLGMTNFDHTIDDGLDTALKDDPGKVYGQHAAWNFCGWVYWDGERFCEDVWQYGEFVETVKCESLEGLMEAVSDEFGHD